jgi:tetratricopeptide (TPR) repeat protein
LSEKTLQNLYDHGKEAFLHRNYDYAVQFFLELLALAPDHVDARKALRICEVRKYDDVGYPSRFLTLLLTLRTWIRIHLQRSPEAVIRICEAHLARDPRNVLVSLSLAEALLATRHADAAQVELQMAREITPDNTKLLLLLGRAYLHKGNVTEARNCFFRVSRLAPGTPELTKVLNDLEATASMQRGYEGVEGQGAVKVTDQSAHSEREQGRPESSADMKGTVQELGRQVETAGTERDKIKFLKKQGEALEKSGDLDGAAAAYQSALDMNDADSTLRDKLENIQVRKLEAELAAAEKADGGAAQPSAGVRQLRSKKLKYEADAWERRVADRPTDVTAHFEYGKRLFLLADIDKAIGEFQLTVRDPRHKIDSYLYLGMAFRFKKLYDMAAAQFTRALETGEAGTDRVLRLRYELAKTLERTSPRKALDEYERILEMDINYKDVSSQVSLLQAKLDDGSGSDSPPALPE